MFGVPTRIGSRHNHGCQGHQPFDDLSGFIEPAQLLKAPPSLERVALSNPVGGTIVDQASRAWGLEGVRGCSLGFLAREIPLTHPMP